MAVRIDVFMTSALDGSEWSNSSSSRFIPGERACIIIGQKTDRPQNLSGQRAEKESITPTGTRTPMPRPSSMKRVAIPNMLEFVIQIRFDTLIC